ncbi:hypothetical protein [Parvicella tangerina]|uniref:Lipoprotein n=1 Tax=Parvicella tangerina TaxID=2829795 RepID=A0A916JLU5_9FLAO|nr:hypothetical protein [Parvicella tangerina]CAG5079941.1 hypothetical protein CRYO30217_01127 [Parvicella tangerina]
MKRNFRFLSALTITALSLAAVSCGDSETNDPDKVGPKPVVTIDSNNTGIINIGGQVFVIPSPIQTADLISKTNAPFDSDLLNPTENASGYSDYFKKALNMGIYGADLGYLAVYNMTDKTTAYLKAVRGLADDIGLGNAFNDELAKKISESLGDEGKMLELVSEAYKTADDYLKENKKDDVASLVIVGGWLESLNFACGAAEATGNQEIIERIADQKNVLKTILAMLKQYRDNEDYDDLAVELEDLQSLFDGITYTYEFVEPVTNEGEKKTTISCKHDVSITKEQVAEISALVKSIRNDIIE